MPWTAVRNVGVRPVSTRGRLRQTGQVSAEWDSCSATIQALLSVTFKREVFEEPPVRSGGVFPGLQFWQRKASAVEKNMQARRMLITTIFEA